MIQSFRCTGTESLFYTGKSKRFASIKAVAERKLTQLAAAATLEFSSRNRATIWRRYRGTERASAAFGSTISGACVSFGLKTDLRMLRLSITTAKQGAVMEVKHD